MEFTHAVVIIASEDDDFGDISETVVAVIPCNNAVHKRENILQKWMEKNVPEEGNGLRYCTNVIPLTFEHQL